MIQDAIVDAIIDSLKMLPFLMVAYLIIEYIEHHRSESMEKVISSGGKFGFISGALLGMIPQCGFSAMASDLYSSSVITVGTLLAVFISTSDEAIPILLSYPEMYDNILIILISKLIIAIVVGFIVDRWICPISRNSRQQLHLVDEVDCHEHHDTDSVFIAALKHTLHIFLFILIITIILNLILLFPIAWHVISSLKSQSFIQIIVSGIIGMIPNCASSILLTQLYIAGNLSLPALIAGLCTGAGIGPVILLRTCRSKKQAILILFALYLIGIISGMISMLIMA